MITTVRYLIWLTIDSELKHFHHHRRLLPCPCDRHFSWRIKPSHCFSRAVIIHHSGWAGPRADQYHPAFVEAWQSADLCDTLTSIHSLNSHHSNTFVLLKARNKVKSVIKNASILSQSLVHLAHYHDRPVLHHRIFRRCFSAASWQIQRKRPTFSTAPLPSRSQISYSARSTAQQRCSTA